MKLDIDYIYYSKNNILEDTSINLNKGIIGIYEKNGEGKSTLLKVLSDYYQHRSNSLIP